MHIAYIINYQGPELISKRNIQRNRSLAAISKCRAITSALIMRGHQVSIFSGGMPAERSGCLYPSFKELQNMGLEHVPIYYSSCWDVKYLNRLTSLASSWYNLKNHLQQKMIDVALIYNCELEGLNGLFCCRMYGGIPVVLEFEDSPIAEREGPPSLISRTKHINISIMKRYISGVIACRSELADYMNHDNRLILPGALNSELIDAAAIRKDNPDKQRPFRLIYAGNLDLSKGADIFLEAVKLIDLPLEIHICGKGGQADKLKHMCHTSKHKAYFHGVVSNTQLYQLLTQADIAINPHRTAWHTKEFWPFKIVEYLASVGTVISSRLGYIDPELSKRLFIYEGDNPENLAFCIINIITNWLKYSEFAPEHRKWAISHYGPNGIGIQIERILKQACS